MNKIRILRTAVIMVLLSTLIIPGPCKAAPEADDKPYQAEETPSYHKKAATYGRVAFSIVNFQAEGVPGGSAHALGLNLKGGVRLTEIVSLEGGLNWIIIPDFPLPIPLTWMPNDDGIYMNLGGGLRFNLVRYDENRTVPWISIWRVGHAVLSDFSVSGNGTSYGLGVDGITKAGKRWQLSLTLHQFTGDLEIYDERDDSLEFRDTDIRALELNIAVSMK